MSLRLKAALLGLLPAVSFAASIEPVVVSAARTAQSAVTIPASITVISRDDIDASGAANISELLRGHGGVQIRDLYGDGSKARVSMRGFSGGNAAANALIMVDGRRLNTTDLGGADLNSISLADVQQVEIIQGSAGSLFGDQAVGGVINVITRQGRAEHIDVEAGIGSYNAQTLSASMGTRMANGFGISVSGESRNSDNYRDNNRNQYRNANLRLDYQYDSGTVFAEAQTITDFLELPGSLTEAELNDDRTQNDPDYPNDFNDSETRVSRFGIKQTLSERWQLEAEFSQRRSESSGISSNSESELFRNQRSFTPRFVGYLPMNGREALITIGADHHSTDFENENPSWSIDRDSDQAINAFYMQAVLPISETFSATIGTRNASVENSITDSSKYPNGKNDNDSVSVYELGLSWQMSPQSRLFVRRDGNYRFALTDENTFTDPDIDFLDTQTGVSYETGYEWQAEGHHFKAVAYRLDLKNEIDYDSTADGPWGAGSGANINLDDTHRTGLIVEGRWRANDQLMLAADYTYTDSEIDGGSFDGNTIPFVAETVIRTSLDWNWHPRSALYVESVYTGERYQDADYDNARDKVEAVNVVNMQLRYHRGPWKAALRVNNLGNAEYSDYATYDAYYPAPERNVMVTMGYAL